MTTTTRLRLRPRDRLRAWLSQRDPIALIAAALLSLIIVGALARQLTIARPIVATPTPALPIIILMTRAPAPPIATPALPPPDPALAAELAALRDRVAELEAAQAAAPEPQIVYQVVNQPAAEQPPEESAPTPAPEPPPLALQQMAILDRQRWAQQVYPTLAPMEQTDTTRAWAAAQWQAEHCVAGVCR